jgi:hypothetical protein
MSKFVFGLHNEGCVSWIFNVLFGRPLSDKDLSWFAVEKHYVKLLYIDMLKMNEEQNYECKFILRIMLCCVAQSMYNTVN